MNRDSKGKFRKGSEEEGDFLTNKMNLFDKPPSVRLILILFLLFWLLSTFLPTQTEMTLTFKNYVCGNKTTSLDGTSREANILGVNSAASTKKFKDG